MNKEPNETEKALVNLLSKSTYLRKKILDDLYDLSFSLEDEPDEAFKIFQEQIYIEETLFQIVGEINNNSVEKHLTEDKPQAIHNESDNLPI